MMDISGRSGEYLTVGTVCEHVARVRPEKIAIVSEERSLTYKELQDEINALAFGLVGYGIKKGDIVAAYLPNCLEYIVVVLAVAKVGAIFSPINSRLKSYEVAKILRASNPRIIFTCKETYEPLVDALVQAKADSALISVDGQSSTKNGIEIHSLALLSTGGVSLVPSVDKDAFFSLMFTSGTTGEPKGVMATHCARMIWVLNAAIEYGLSSDDVYLGTMPQVHSAGLTFTLMHLYVGAKVHILKHFDASEFLRVVSLEKITSALTVPTMLKMIIDELKECDGDYRLDSLRRVVTCGSPLASETKREVVNRLTSQLFDYYGSTESNSMTVLKPEEQLERPNSVGKPFRNVQLMVADDKANPMPPEDVGIIYCKNPSAMACYLNRPEETRAIFMGEWLKTGDLGYLDNDGYLYLVGREKDTIITGGINVYPSEVEGVLVGYRKIAECAVVGVDDEKWGQVVKVFVVPKAGFQVSLAEVQEHCDQYLADFKKPRLLEIVPEIPRTVTGKVRKDMLGTVRRAREVSE